jgi:hypothetical protein
VTFNITTKDKVGEVETISSAYVRLHVGGRGIHDSTVSNSQVTVDDAKKTVKWSLPQSVTATLPLGQVQGELVLIDPTGEQRIPANGGRFALTVEARASAPV